MPVTMPPALPLIIVMICKEIIEGQPRRYLYNFRQSAKNPPEGGFFESFICPRGEADARESRGKWENYKEDPEPCQ